VGVCCGWCGVWVFVLWVMQGVGLVLCGSISAGWKLSGACFPATSPTLSPHLNPPPGHTHTPKPTCQHFHRLSHQHPRHHRIGGGDGVDDVARHSLRTERALGGDRVAGGAQVGGGGDEVDRDCIVLWWGWGWGWVWRAEGWRAEGWGGVWGVCLGREPPTRHQKAYAAHT